MTRKIEGWEKKLGEFIETNTYRPFQWGQFDCCLAACDGVKTITGVDVGAPFKGKYHDAFGGLRAMHEYSGGAILETVTKLADEFDAPEIDADEMMAGDIACVKVKSADPVAVRLTNGITMAIMGFNDFMVIPGVNGLVFQKNVEVVKAWKI